jgi:hypothetical protein
MRVVDGVVRPELNASQTGYDWRMSNRFVLCLLTSFLLAGALSVFLVPVVLSRLRAWVKRRVEARSVRPRQRDVLCERQLRLAKTIESYGRENGDPEMELLAVIVRQATHLVRLESAHAFRLRELRDTADVVARHQADKWWRRRKVWPTARTDALLREVGRDDPDAESVS